MLGKILSICENEIELEISSNLTEIQNLNDFYVLIADKSMNYIGEITSVNRNVINIRALGEFVNGRFVSGLSTKPSFSSKVDLIDNKFVNNIIGLTNELSEIYVGKSEIYKDVRVGANINDFFGQHFAIIGSTGSGKSCGFASIIQNLFNREVKPKKSSIFVFDSYGEYYSAFSHLSKTGVFKSITTNLKSLNEKVNIPVWLMDIDDLAILLNVEKSSQLIILEKALKFLDVFSKKDVETSKYKSSVIAKALLEIILSGRNASQIRDQFISILSKYNTPELNLETEIIQPGYVRTIRQCLLIDESGKIRSIEVLSDLLSKYTKSEVNLHLPDKSYYYTLNDVLYALDFALIDEGILRNEEFYNDIYYLKANLITLCTSESYQFFNYPKYITLSEYIQLLSTVNGQKAQIVNVNINYVDDRFAKAITKIFSKMLFEYCKKMEPRSTFPIHIILEEAHRYVQKDNDVKILGYNIFERISKEGRKYGVLLGLISQRPMEISGTCLSQCSNYLLFKMLHPKDLKFITSIVPNISEYDMKKMKILKPGSCMAFGTAFKLPTMIKVEMPNPMPSSSNCDIQKTWF